MPARARAASGSVRQCSGDTRSVCMGEASLGQRCSRSAARRSLQLCGVGESKAEASRTKSLMASLEWVSACLSNGKKKVEMSCPPCRGLPCSSKREMIESGWLMGRPAPAPPPSVRRSATSESASRRRSRSSHQVEGSSASKSVPAPPPPPPAASSRAMRSVGRSCESTRPVKWQSKTSSGSASAREQPLRPSRDMATRGERLIAERFADSSWSSRW
mmetsp:Transcript_22068/g.70480  ORF Transcript_22068/g.70480 Transcript_22068/m.70480 type:complete len:217 (-) Transcript_22068:358-1008(-)